MTTRMPDVAELLTCGICLSSLSAARRACAHEHLFCAACLDASVARTGPACPVCRDPVVVDARGRTGLPSALADGVVAAWRVACPNQGCDEVCALAGLAEHRQACPHEVVRCPYKGCRVEAKRRDMPTHMRADLEEHLQMEATRRDAFQVDTGLALRGLRFEVEAARDETRRLKRKLDRALGDLAVIRACVDPSAPRRPREEGGGEEEERGESGGGGGGGGGASPTYSPTSPTYSPTSPSYSPV